MRFARKPEVSDDFPTYTDWVLMLPCHTAFRGGCPP